MEPTIGPIEHSESQCREGDCDCWCAICERHNHHWDLLSPEEGDILDGLNSVVFSIRQWGIKANEQELISAVHVIQGFVIQHMLSRLSPDEFTSWFGDDDASTSA